MGIKDCSSVTERFPELSTNPHPLLPVGLDVVDEAVGAGVVPMGQLISPQLRLNNLGQLLAKLNTGVCGIVFGVGKVGDHIMN